jgi:hypothetical protein
VISERAFGFQRARRAVHCQYRRGECLDGEQLATFDTGDREIALPGFAMAGFFVIPRRFNAGERTFRGGPLASNSAGISRDDSRIGTGSGGAVGKAARSPGGAEGDAHERPNVRIFAVRASTTLADFWVAMRFGDSQGGFCVIHRWSALEGRPWVEDGKRSLNSG